MCKDCKEMVEGRLRQVAPNPFNSVCSQADREQIFAMLDEFNIAGVLYCRQDDCCNYICALQNDIDHFGIGVYYK